MHYLSRIFVCQSKDCHNEVTTEWMATEDAHWSEKLFLCTPCSNDRRLRLSESSISEYRLDGPKV